LLEACRRCDLTLVKRILSASSSSSSSSPSNTQPLSGSPRSLTLESAEATTTTTSINKETSVVQLPSIPVKASSDSYTAATSSSSQSRNTDLIRFRHPFTGDTPLHMAFCNSSTSTLPSDTPAVATCARGGGEDPDAAKVTTGGKLMAVNAAKKEPPHSTPASSLAHNQLRQLLDFLLSRGASHSERNAGGQVPLHLAAAQGCLEGIQRLLQFGADVNAVDARGHSPLHIAASNGRVAAVRLLLEWPATDRTLTTASGLTAVQSTNSGRVRRLFYEHTGCCRAEEAEAPAVSVFPQGDCASWSEMLRREQNPTPCFSGDSTTLCNADPTPCTHDEVKLVEDKLRKNNQNSRSPKASKHRPSSHFSGPVAATKVEATRGVIQPAAAAAAAINCSSSARISPAVLEATVSTVVLSPQPVASDDPAGSSGLVRSLPAPSAGPPVIYAWASMVLQLLEAAKAGDVEMVYRLIVSCQNHVSASCTTDSTAAMTATVGTSKGFRPPSDLINCRDIDGRHSTPLHFAAGYNRLGVVELLLQFGADVHAKDKGGLVPLHNACSYGHAKVAELLIQHGANVNVTDLWRFTPLHEAAAKGKFDICRLLLKHGADPTKKNRDGHTPLDLVKDTDSLVYDLLRGDIAVLEAAKRGNLTKIQRLIIPENINCRDTQGRNSTPLHLAAEFLLDMGADANAQDKGGLIPLHNASSYGHIDVAALLIRHGTSVNAVDKWGYTPLHEAAQKGRTQLCSLLLAHGANPNARNEEGQTPYDLATADDVKSLLADAMPLPTLPDSLSANGLGSNNSAFTTFPATVHVGPRIEGQGQETPDTNAVVNVTHPTASTSGTQSTLTTATFLNSIGLDHLVELFDKEQSESLLQALEKLGVSSHFIVYHSGSREFSGRHSAAIVLSQQINHVFILWEPVSDRLAYARLKRHFTNILSVFVYAASVAD
uniref:ANK_REP_REGION domain-containing protein n=1 Tax=Schistocephalus solidus TaxID=70667 RepID=A0A183TH09_SCHSO